MPLSCEVKGAHQTSTRDGVSGRDVRGERGKEMELLEMGVQRERDKEEMGKVREEEGNEGVRMQKTVRNLDEEDEK